MKKVTLLMTAVLFFLSLHVFAQTFPDGSFENKWHYFNNPIPGKSDYWDFVDGNFISTLNQLYELSGDQGDAPLTAFRDVDAWEGNYALKLVSNTMTFGEPLFLPGAAGTLSINFIDLACILGQPFTHRPLQFTGHYKSFPLKGDSAAIEVFVKKSGQILGHGKMVIKDTVNVWTSFNIPLTYTSNQTPDSVVVIFASSAGYDFSSLETLMQCKGQNGSTLIVDDVAFGYQQGVKEMFMPEVEMSVYPNPASDRLQVAIQEPLNGKLIMYDYAGKEIKTYRMNGSQLDIDINHLASGSYFINLVEKDKTVSSKQFIKK